MTEDNVLYLSAARQERRPNYPKVVVVDRVIPTGTKPPLVYADDDNAYILKFLNNDHGPEATINEVVVSVIGEAIGAPVAPWSIVRVPESLRQIVGNRIIEPGLAFGSRVLPTVGVARMGPTITNVNRDGNINRIPQLIALWHLCNALDIQVVFDSSEDNKIYSVDHGLWFGSHPYPWGLDRRSGFPEIDEVPLLREPIADECWDRAIEGLDSLDESLKDRIVAAIPSEWNVGRNDVGVLVDFVISKKSSAISELRRYRQGR
ncbi:HipA family kinase [Corynebacterium striatum]|uniref:HipA family kinase n=1 Tax=Corynebacterium striatum TaxID=43770 RepID=UPI001A2D0CAD|nr:hypothetical protein [Corynebacterium striatum]HAT1392742.1 hypothetical protein [Corynebacterium striatum]